MLYCFHCGYKIISTEYATGTNIMRKFIEKSKSAISELEYTQ